VVGVVVLPSDRFVVRLLEVKQSLIVGEIHRGDLEFVTLVLPSLNRIAGGNLLVC